MANLIVCGRYYKYNRVKWENGSAPLGATIYFKLDDKKWKNSWHPPAACIRCDSLRHTRSAAAGLQTRTSYRKLPPAITKIIFTFVDWVEVYGKNLECAYNLSFVEIIRRAERMPSSVELQAYDDTGEDTNSWCDIHRPIAPTLARLLALDPRSFGAVQWQYLSWRDSDRLRCVLTTGFSTAGVSFVMRQLPPEALPEHLWTPLVIVPCCDD